MLSERQRKKADLHTRTHTQLSISLLCSYSRWTTSLLPMSLVAKDADPHETREQFRSWILMTRACGSNEFWEPTFCSLLRPCNITASWKQLVESIILWHVAFLLNAGEVTGFRLSGDDRLQASIHTLVFCDANAHWRWGCRFRDFFVSRCFREVCSGSCGSTTACAAARVQVEKGSIILTSSVGDSVAWSNHESICLCSGWTWCLWRVDPSMSLFDDDLVKRNISGGIPGLINNGGSSPNGSHLRPGCDWICLVVTLNVLQLQVVGLKVLDILFDSFRFFVQYITWRSKFWADEVGNMQMARESVFHFCQSNLSRKGQNLDTKTVDFDDSGSLWIRHLIWNDTFIDIDWAGIWCRVPCWCDCCCLLRCQQPYWLPYWGVSSAPGAFLRMPTGTCLVQLSFFIHFSWTILGTVKL